MTAELTKSTPSAIKLRLHTSLTNTMKPKTCETCASKRRYSSHEETASSNDENEGKARVSKKPSEKKIRERTSPPTTDNERGTSKSTKEKTVSVTEAAQKLVSSAEIDKIVSDTVSVSIKPRDEKHGGKRIERVKEPRDSSEQNEKSVEIIIEEAIKERAPDDKEHSDTIRRDDVTGSLKDEIKEIEQLWATIEGKRNISVGNKGPRDSFLYDFLGEEVDRDEAEALEALNFYWLNTVAKSAAKPPTDIPEEHKDFYNKYCNGTRELTAESAMKLMSLPHVVTVNLKSNAKIEVVVSDIFLALQDSPELRHEDFEVVEAMGMHLF